MALLNFAVCRSKFVSTETKRNVHVATLLGNVASGTALCVYDAPQISLPFFGLAAVAARQAWVEHRQLR